MKRLVEQNTGRYGRSDRRIWICDQISVRSYTHKIYRRQQPYVPSGTNVIENALKYSLKGTRIFLRITEADQNIKLEVVNTASYEMNFTEEEIMERFARAEKSRTSEGNGLGLSIADSFTKNCGGEFSIRIDGDQFLLLYNLNNI